VFGTRVVPIFNYFQASLLLFGDGLLSSAALLRVVDTIAASGYTPTAMANSLQDLMRRRFLPVPLLRRLARLLDDTEEILGQPATKYGQSFRDAIDGLEQLDRPKPARETGIDYLALADGTRYKPTRQLFPRLPWLSDY
jgi:hypothetical protein